MADAPVKNDDQHEPTPDEISAKATADRVKEIKARDDLDAKDKKILLLYDQGVQLYKIAQEVYEFVNQDTVGKCLLVIRKEHSDDFNELEDIASTKGYSGIGSAK